MVYAERDAAFFFLLTKLSTPDTALWWLDFFFFNQVLFLDHLSQQIIFQEYVLQDGV